MTIYPPLYYGCFLFGSEDHKEQCFPHLAIYHLTAVIAMVGQQGAACLYTIVSNYLGKH